MAEAIRFFGHIVGDQLLVEVAERLKLETLGVTIIYQQEVATPERFAASLKRVHAKLAATCSHVGTGSKSSTIKMNTSASIG